jgi:hypothetical protein
MTERRPAYHEESSMRPSTLTGALAVLAMLLLASPGVRVERAPAAAPAPVAASAAR